MMWATFAGCVAIGDAMFNKLFGGKNKQEKKKKQRLEKRGARQYNSEGVQEALEHEQEMDEQRQQRMDALKEALPFMDNDNEKPKKDHKKENDGPKIGGMD